MRSSIICVLLLVALAVLPTGWAAGDQDEVETELGQVVAGSKTYSVEVLQREHQRYRGSSPVYSILDGGRAVAILKCNSTAGTDAAASRATYEISRALGLRIYSVTVLPTPEFLSALRRTSGGKFDYAKDDCALKEFHAHGQYTWREQRSQHFYRNLDPVKWTLRNALRCDESLPKDAGQGESFFIEGEGNAPRADGGGSRQYRNPTTLLSAARDFSSLMLMDAIVGNGDRFIAGENVHFRSQRGAEGRKVDAYWVFDDVHFLSLDNGTTFKGSKRPLRLLAHVTRFDRNFVDRVREMAAQLEAPDAKRSDLLRMYPFLDLETSGGQPALEFVKTRMRLVLDHVHSAERRCGAQAYFP